MLGDATVSNCRLNEEDGGNEIHSSREEWIRVGHRGEDKSKVKIISWNIKGLGSPTKNFSIKEVLRKYKANVIMLQETKKAFIDKKCFHTMWGGRNRDWIFTLASGSAGAMLMAWKKNICLS